MTEKSSSLNKTSVVRIDGNKVRRLRESKGLTQLYVATVVGVTTDTISRWENRRYPTIKRENAEKLAAALEVGLEEILEEEPEAQDKETATETEPPTAESAEKISGYRKYGPETEEKFFGKAFSSPARFILLTLVLALLAGLTWYFLMGIPVKFKSERLLPRHAAPGQTFPVVITVECETSGPVSLILRENLPRECIPQKALPPFTAWDKDAHRLKWLFHSEGARATFLYLASVAPDTSMGSILRFQGTATVRKGVNNTQPVQGPGKLEVLPLHWADVNGDGKIDDEEILTVYEELGRFQEVDFGLRQIEAIWAGEGYRWDEKSKSFLVIE